MATANVTSLQAVGPNEKLASLDPKEYQYSAPTAQQQQQMYQQFVQMAFFCFSQMQMQNAMCQGASGQMPFPGTFMPGFPMPGFPNPAFCGMPPLPPGFFPMVAPPTVPVTATAAAGVKQEVAKPAPASNQALPASTEAAACSQQTSAGSIKEASCTQPKAQSQDPVMDCVMELSMDDIQKLFEDVDEPSAVTTALQSAGSLDSLDYPRASSPSGSLGSTNTAARASDSTPAAAASPGQDTTSLPALQHIAEVAPASITPPSAQALPSDANFADMDFENLISVPNCPVSASCKLEQLDASLCDGGLFDGMVPEVPAKACAANATVATTAGARQEAGPKKLRASGGVRKQSKRLKDKGLASLAVQDAIDAVGDYLDSEEPADWEAMLFPMALDSEPYGLSA